MEPDIEAKLAAQIAITRAWARGETKLPESSCTRPFVYRLPAPKIQRPRSRAKRDQTIWTKFLARNPDYRH